jgi:DNA-binding NarL/FixJ family response regulator
MGAAPPILVADGDPTCRELLTELLHRIGYATVTAATGAEALEAAARLRPSLVLLDVNLPQISGYEVCRELRDAYGTDIAVIFFSRDRTTPADKVAGLLVGADDYVAKPFDDDELLARVRATLRRIPATATSAERDHGVAATLTAREREVLALLAGGLSQTEIARRLYISPKTVGGHIQRVLAKLGVHSRAQAVARAHEHGLVDVEGHGVGSPLPAV